MGRARSSADRGACERVTVTMPAELVAGIDQLEGNRSRFIASAVRHDVQRRHRQALLRPLKEPHPETLATASLGLEAWGEGPCRGWRSARSQRGCAPALEPRPGLAGA